MTNKLFPKSAPQQSEAAKPARDPVAERLFPTTLGDGSPQPDESAIESEPAAKFEPSRDPVAARMFPKVAEKEAAAEQSEADDQAKREAAAELRPISGESLLRAVENLEGFEFVVDEEAAEQASEILADLDLDLTTGQQSTLVRAAAKHVERILDQADTARIDHFESQIRDWEAEVTASPEGGRDVADARGFITEFDSGDLKNFLNDSGLGSFPGLIKALANAHRALAELRGSSQ